MRKIYWLLLAGMICLVGCETNCGAPPQIINPDKNVCRNVDCGGGTCDAAVTALGYSYAVCICYAGYTLSGSKVCIKACKSDADCAKGQGCVKEVCSQVDCKQDIDCAKAQICREYACKTGCRVNGDCESGKICDGNWQCITPNANKCASDSECAGGYQCRDGSCQKVETVCVDGKPTCTFDTGWGMEFYDKDGGTLGRDTKWVSAAALVGVPIKLYDGGKQVCPASAKDSSYALPVKCQGAEWKELRSTCGSACSTCGSGAQNQNNYGWVAKCK